MKLRSVHAENFRAIRSLTVPLDPALTVLVGNNGHGKTSLLAAIAVGLGVIPTILAGRGGISFRKSDGRYGTSRTWVEIDAWDVAHGANSIQWLRLFTERGGIFLRLPPDLPSGSFNVRDYSIALNSKIETAPATTIPVFAFYDTDRAVFDIPERKRGFQSEFHRFNAYVDALARKTSFKALVEWFYASENRELRLQRDQLDYSLRLPALESVRRAITAMLPDVSNPHIEYPAQFVVQRAASSGRGEKLALDQLSGGYRIVLALAADLALRMALANPHLEDPLQSEAIVLIDEIELHLHPEWQQRILDDLRRTFPNAQFIVSTHSPAVLTTVEPHHIVHLIATADGVVAEQETGPTFGAKAGDVLASVMGVEQRPPANPFTQKLAVYQAMITDDAGDTPEAKTLRAELEQLSRDDPALAASDVEIAHRRLMRELAGTL